MSSSIDKITSIARVKRKIVEGEVVEVHLEVFRDETQIHLNDGDDFVTIETKMDLFEVPRG